MSYASVAAHNAPSSSDQPHPDPALLTTETPSHDSIADDAAKINIVAPDFKQNPATVTSTADIPAESAPVPISGGVPDHTSPNEKSRGQNAADKAKYYAQELEDEGFYLWNLAKHWLLRPGVAGGLLGVVNVGLLGFASYSLYNKPNLRRDTKLLSSTAAAAFALLSAEGYAAEKYLKTPAGQEEQKRARKEGAAIYRVIKENLLRPGILGGLVGVLNTAILGTVGFYSYRHWDSRQWDRRIVSAVSVGLLTLWTGEGYLVERYRQTHH
ncbi:hypothetical protein BDY19DRAFT_988466 [Irpex rosettiformis]|uniref:Uncharacterized protein n=1 Tax=Irpex rosettiformis TaxID=378272 RepID=A0ACB8UKJ0_9APHY|nr:hypothetical protein BDY19DRAFT_988466 [Irpex rosettiformis]